MVVSNGVYGIKGNDKIMVDGDGCLYTDTYCFHGSYIFKYNTDILLGNFYYAPTSAGTDGNFVINLASHTVTPNNLIGAYSVPAWFNDLCFMLTKRPYTVKFSLCRGSRVNTASGTEQSEFLNSGSFNASEYSLSVPAPSLLGTKVTSVANVANISGNATSITATNYTRALNNLYYSIFVSLT